MGLFHAFVGDARVALFGVEAAGDGIETGRHAATLGAGRVGVLHGSKSYVLTDDDGQIAHAHSISAGLDYPGVGPEHAWLKDTGRALYASRTDDEALDGAAAARAHRGHPVRARDRARDRARSTLAPKLGAGKLIVVGLSGRGDKDMETVAAATGVKLQ